MSTTVTGKLNDSAREFQAGESIGFGLRLGVQFYNRTSKQKEWTNYEGAVFSNKQNQIDFMRNNLIAGSIITLTGKTLEIKQFQSNNGLKLSIGLNDCNLDFIYNPSQAPQQQPAQQQQQQSYQQQAPQQQQQQAPAQQHRPSPSQNTPNSQQFNQQQGESYQQAPPPNLDEFDNDIPF